MNQHHKIIEDVLNSIYNDIPKEHWVSVLRNIYKLFEDKSIGSFKGSLPKYKLDALQSVTPAIQQRESRKASKKANKEALNLEKDLEKLYWKFKKNQITKTRFKKDMKSALYLTYIKMYELGTQATGVDTVKKLSTTLSVSERKWLDSASKEEQGYFNKFLDNVISGEKPDTVVRRIEGYAQATLSIFSAARVLQIGTDKIIHWILEPGVNHCPDCLEIHKHSPYLPIYLPTTPKAGLTRCRQNCYCELRIVKGTEKQIERVRKKNQKPNKFIKKIRDAQQKKR